MQGPWSDLYALGGTLYRAVAGKAPEEATLRFDEDLMASAAELGRGRYRPEFLEAVDACLKVKHSERPRSVAQLRPMLLGRRSQPIVVELPRSRTPSLPRILEAAMPQERRRWAAAAAVAVLVAGLGGGLAYKSTIAVARQSPEMNVAEKTEDRREAQRRKDIADAAETDALRQAEADATAERKREDELRTAALDEAQRRDERRKEDERVRLATIPSGEEQTAFVRRVQEALKRNQCHDGNVTGRADEAQESVDRFVENAKRSGRAQAPRIKLAKASVGDFEIVAVGCREGQMGAMFARGTQGREGASDCVPTGADQGSGFVRAPAVGAALCGVVRREQRARPHHGHRALARDVLQTVHR